ncbi:MAG: TonB-dependent receptor [Daejeonella sp.]
MKKFLFMALMVMMIPLMASAQYTLSGKVFEKRMATGLAGATILLKEIDLSAQSNEAGEFTFPQLTAGTYTIRVTYVGYRAMEKRISLNSDIQVDFTLESIALLSDEVIVKATRASANSATTYKNLDRAELQKNNSGRDIPYLLNQTPSVVVSSDAGAGIGYTGIRIRGSDATRINVTLNGIPFNDAESQGSFFVDLPDFASSVDNIQVQRGVGTSANGAGAFGGSLNIQTTTLRDSAYAELNNTYGSYQTIKNTLNIGTGLLNDQFSFDGRLSRIQSDGYIDRASSRLKSYFLSGAYYGKHSLLRANVFSVSEKTYQAWNGVPQALLSTNRTFNSFTYDDQTDNYTQDHYQLLYSNALLPELSVNGALHYTHGKGYYEEYKDGQELSKYGIEPVSIGGSIIEESNLIRRRWLDNDFYGLTYSLNYHPRSTLNFTLSGAYNEYKGNHFGEVIWAQFASNSTIRQRYYDGDSFKTDHTIFGKAEYHPGKFSLFADLQYRNINYTIGGTDKNRNALAIREKFNFFNPKFGLSYQVNRGNSVYASFAVANKEPNRDDLVNSTPLNRPKPENLKDMELGYRTSGEGFTAGINGYYMQYKDQLILTGKINDAGEYIRQNVPDSYRLGIELDGKVQISDQLSWAATLALSKNKLKTFTEFLDDYDNGGQLISNYTNTALAFSPDVVASGELSFKPFAKTEIALLSKYVGEQYLDNTSNNNRKINSFFVNDVRLSYNTSFKGIKNIGLTLLVNNIFNHLYESNGYTFTSFAGGVLTTENNYFPQATRNFLLSLSLKF